MKISSLIQLKFLCYAKFKPLLLKCRFLLYTYAGLIILYFVIQKQLGFFSLHIYKENSTYDHRLSAITMLNMLFLN